MDTANVRGFGGRAPFVGTPALLRQSEYSGQMEMRMPALHRLPNSNLVASVNGVFITTCDDGVKRAIRSRAGYAQFDVQQLKDAISLAAENGEMYSCQGNFGRYGVLDAALVVLPEAIAQAWGVDGCKIKTADGVVLSGVICVSDSVLALLGGFEANPLSGRDAKTYDLVSVEDGLAAAKAITAKQLNDPAYTAEAIGVVFTGDNEGVRALQIPRGKQRQAAMAERRAVEGDDDIVFGGAAVKVETPSVRNFRRS